MYQKNVNKNMPKSQKVQHEIASDKEEEEEMEQKPLKMGGKKNPVFEDNDDVVSSHTQERNQGFNEDMPIVVKNIQSNY